MVPFRIRWHKNTFQTKFETTEVNALKNLNKVFEFSSFKTFLFFAALIFEFCLRDKWSEVFEFSSFKTFLYFVLICKFCLRDKWIYPQSNSSRQGCSAGHNHIVLQGQAELRRCCQFFFNLFCLFQHFEPNTFAWNVWVGIFFIYFVLLVGNEVPISGNEISSISKVILSLTP